MSKSPDLNALRLFERVAATGSFTATAHHFQLAVSSVSRQIATLEKTLGQRLLYRHTRAVSLTDAGERYYDEVREALERLDLATEALGDRGAQPGGTLRINGPVAFMRRQIVPLLSRWQARYPAIHAELLLTDTFTDPVREGSDITFRIGTLADSGLVARRLASMHYVLAAAPAYLQRRGTPDTPTALRGHDCLVYHGEFGRQRWFFRRGDAGAHEPMSVPGTLSSNDAESLVSAALLGQGIVLFPSWLIGAELAAGTLQPLLPDWDKEITPQPQTIHVVAPGKRLRSRTVSLFMDYLFDCVGEIPPWDRWAEPPQR
ncbi:LysR family transcriptional regulator [Salinisphaera aquimarina]|uniref:LysR substrate-binding domain-containing protein n=1 Tax=Salinisphaera aquimarina TaxID=2094031 RepID=A0ABV7ELC6_9GAMM